MDELAIGCTMQTLILDQPHALAPDHDSLLLSIMEK
jgi:hypothetical protein